MRAQPRIRLLGLVGVGMAVLLLNACSGGERTASGPSTAPASETAISSLAPEDPPVQGIRLYPPTVGDVVALAFPRAANVYLPLTGGFLPAKQHEGLFGVAQCTFGCKNVNGALQFGLPKARPIEGPAPGTVAWQVADDGNYPDPEVSPRRWLAPLFAGEVYFTVIRSDELNSTMERDGFVPVPLGASVAEGVRASRVPANFPQPTQDDMLRGRLRLFAPGVAFPRGVEPADGHRVPESSSLGVALRKLGYPVVNGSIALPHVSPIDGYRWGIDAVGEYPYFRDEY